MLCSDCGKHSFRIEAYACLCAYNCTHTRNMALKILALKMQTGIIWGNVIRYGSRVGEYGEEKLQVV